MEYFIGTVQQNVSNFDFNEIFARFYNLKGTLRADEGKFNEAIEYYNKAIEQNPFFSIAFFNRGTIKADMGNFCDAQSDFDKARELELNYIKTKVHLLKTMINKNEDKESTARKRNSSPAKQSNRL